MRVIGTPAILDRYATARAAAALAAAGAFDATPTEVDCADFEFMTLYITYTRAGAGGAVNFYVEVSPRSTDLAGSEDWFQAAIIAGGAVAAGGDTTSSTQREDIEYQATAAGAETFVYGPVELRGTVERIRIPCAESGAVGAPGTCEVVAVFS